MVLEGLAAVSAAAAVVQFVGYGYQVISKGNEFYRSTNGTLEDNAILESSIKDFKFLLDRIEQSPIPASRPVRDFRDEGLKLATEMMEGLEELKVKGVPGRTKSLKKALKTVHSKAKINSWVKKLDALRDRFNNHIELDILEKVELSDLKLSTAFQELEKQQREMLQTFMDALCDGQDVFEKKVIAHLMDVKTSISSEHTVTRTQISKSHQETLDAIKTEHQASRSLSKAVAEDTLAHTAVQHDVTRTHIARGAHKLQRSILSGQAKVTRLSKSQHDDTRNTVMDSIMAQGVSIEQNMKDDHQQTTDVLEATVFRAQLENERNMRQEHALMRQAMQLTSPPLCFRRDFSGVPRFVHENAIVQKFKRQSTEPLSKCISFTPSLSECFRLIRRHHGPSEWVQVYLATDLDKRRDIRHRRDSGGCSHLSKAAHPILWVSKDILALCKSLARLHDTPSLSYRWSKDAVILSASRPNRARL